ncbi:discoidin domain-containing protein [Campylobacter jejuni]|nr:discoidin domain-containing protein [Campylobacter jejuni]
MDIISYSKAMKAKKRITEFNERLGEGNNKSGDRDIKDVYANTKIRLEELEKKRLGLLERAVIYDSSEDWGKGTLERLDHANGILTLGVGNENYGGDIIKDRSSINASSTFSSSTPISNVTDNDSTSIWQSGTGLKSATIEITFPTPKSIGRYIIQATAWPTMSPRAFTFEALVNGSWIVLDSQQKSWTQYQEETFTIDVKKVVFSTGYRIVITSNNGANEIGIAKMGLMELSIADNGTWESPIIEFSQDMISLESISLEGTGLVNVKTHTKTENDREYVVLNSDGSISSVFGKTVQVKLGLTNGTDVPKIDKLTVMYKVRSLLNRISEIESNTNINLNKHNLRVDTILNKRRYKLKEMVVDDFEDASGIDMAQSVNITHDIANHKVKQTDATQESAMVTVKETLEAAPTVFTVSAVVNDIATMTKDIDFASGILTDTIMNGEELEMMPVALDEYKKSASWESSVIDLGEGFTRIVRFDKVVDIPSGTGLKMLTSSSADGITFEEYREVNSDGTIASSSRRYFKVKAEFTAKEEVQPPRIIHDFASVETANFTVNDKIILDGSAKLKTAYSQAMIPVEGYAEEGSLLKTPIDKTMFKSIEKVEVK